VSSAAATAVAFAVAAALSFRVPRRARMLLVVAVLLVPIVLASPWFVQKEREAASASARSSIYSTPPPFRWHEANERLIEGVLAHVPAHESVWVVNGRFETGWVRWLAYSIAPRQLTNAHARWAIVFGKTPAQAGLHPIHAWPYRGYWLVEN
jgi:hypothetical protein